MFEPSAKAAVKPYTFDDFKEEYKAFSEKLQLIHSEFLASVDEMRFYLRPVERELLERQRELIAELKALEPGIAPLLKKLEPFEDHPDSFLYRNLTLDFYHALEFYPALYSKLFDIFLFNTCRGRPPACSDAQSLTSDSIAKRKAIIEAASGGSGASDSARDGEDGIYLRLLSALNIAETFFLHSFLTDNQALRNSVRDFLSMLRCPGIPFYHVFEETPGESVPGIQDAWDSVLETYCDDLLGYMESLEDLRAQFDDNLNFRAGTLWELRDRIPPHGGLVESASYDGVFELKRNRVIVTDLRTELVRSAGGHDYEERRGRLEFVGNDLYLGDQRIGQTTWLPFAQVGIEALAYAEKLKGLFVQQTDQQGRLFLCGLPRYLEFPFRKQEIIFIGVQNDEVSLRAEDGALLVECALTGLRAAQPTTLRVQPGETVEEHAWPLIAGSSIPVAGPPEAVRRVHDAFLRIKAAAPERYAEIVSRLRYVDLITPCADEKKIAEAYPYSRRIGIFLNHMDGSIDQVMEGICHEVLGHIKLRAELGPLTGHFSMSIARARLSLENLTSNFWTSTKTCYDAEIVDEAYALSQHIAAMLDIHNDVLSAGQQDKYTRYLHFAAEELELTLSDAVTRDFMSKTMQNFNGELAEKIGRLQRRLEHCTVLPA